MGAGILLALGLLLGVVGLAPVASAHHAYVSSSVTTECLPTGEIRVSYRVDSWAGAGALGTGTNKVYNTSVGVQYRTNTTNTFDNASLAGLSPDVAGTPKAFTRNNGSGTPFFTGSFDLPQSEAGRFLQLRSYPKASWYAENGASQGSSPTGEDSFSSTNPPVQLPGCQVPATPSATAALVCASATITVTFTGAGSATTVDVVKGGVLVGDDVPVPVGPSTYAVPLDPADENTTVTIALDYAAASATDQLDLQVPVDCDEPSPVPPTASVDCVAGELVVTVGNTGSEGTSASVTYAGETRTVEVPAGAPSVPVVFDLDPADENGTATATVAYAGQDPQDASAGVNCLEPSPVPPTASVDCVAGELVVTVGNTGSEGTSASVTYAGETRTVEVPAGAPSVPVVFDLDPADENGTATATVAYAGQDPQDASAGVNCLEPSPVPPTASVDCAAGELVVTVGNTGSEGTSASVTYAGETRTVEVPAGAPSVPVVFDLDPADENGTATATVTYAGTAPQEASAGVNCLEPDPSLPTAEVVCAEGLFVVTLGNTGSEGTSATVTYAGETRTVEVPAGSTVPVVFDLDPADENGTATATVTYAGSAPQEASAGVSCEEPGVAGYSLECAEGVIVVTLTNSGEAPTTVIVNGEEVEIPAGATLEHELEAPENTTVEILVTDEDGNVLLEAEVPVDCDHPAPVVDEDVECATGGLAVTLDNTEGTDTAELVVRSANLPDGSVTVTVEAGGSTPVIVPVEEDASTDITVTSGDEVLFEDTVTRDCETVVGGVVTPEAPTSLPRTGTATKGLLELAGILLLAGAVLVTASRRRDDAIQVI